MEVVDRYGLTLALVDADEAADEPWRRAAPRVDVVRVDEPPRDAWPLLAGLGFVRKPRAVTWTAGLGPDEGAFLAPLRRVARRDLRRAQRRAAAGGLRETVEDPVTARSLDAFLKLYEERVAAMRFGVPFALGHRDAVLHGPERFFGVFAREADGSTAGGCLVREEPQRDTAVIRFSAVTAEWRRASLARVLYLTAMRAAREKGYGHATLADEPNLIGHLTKPGLFLFKSDLGFRTVPSELTGDPDGGQEADLVRHLGALHDPTLILGYVDGRSRDLAPHLFHGGDPPADAGRFAVPFLAPPVLHRVPGRATGPVP